MNGAESVVRTMMAGGIDVCFANPGTSELHFVAALDQVGGIKCVLCLFEGVTTGAADGYARMTGRPAATMMHLGPGLANGLANLHNAKRARTPLLNIVGDHARDHVKLDAPLTSDVEGVARPFSDWVRTCREPAGVSTDTAEAIAACQGPPGQIATLILPTDIAWSDAQEPVGIQTRPARPTVADESIEAIAGVLARGEPSLFYVTGQAVSAEGLDLLARITAATGADMLTPINNPRIERGAGRHAIERLYYPVDPALERLAPYRHIVFLETVEPVAFFAYPGKPGRLVPDGASLHRLTTPGEDSVDALTRLADRVGAPSRVDASPLDPGPRPDGELTSENIAAVLQHTIPENAVVCDESLTTGRGFFPATHVARPHTWLQITGGAIGQGPPLATGAAVGSPDRPVLALQADGSAMYTMQALWTQARENLDVTTVIFANHQYRILGGELRNIGVDMPGEIARSMIDLDKPKIDWVSLAKGMGVEAVRTDDAAGLADLIRTGTSQKGPFLIEASVV